MKKLLHISLFLIIHSGVVAQYEYRFADKGNTRYMVSGGCGIGASYWWSKIENTSLYNKYGSPIKSGYVKYKSQTDITCYDLNVVAPVAEFMLGLGINFEMNKMDKIDIKSPADGGSLIYDQRFRIEKVYGIIEVPLQKEIIRNFIVDAQLRLGFYGYSGVDRDNFFGQTPMPSTYVYFQPYAEYKYFHNNLNEYPSKITHKIATFSATLGVRIDVSRR